MLVETRCSLAGHFSDVRQLIWPIIIWPITTPLPDHAAPHRAGAGLFLRAITLMGKP